MPYKKIPVGLGFFIIVSVLFLFSALFLAALSAASFPSMPVRALTQAIVHLCVRQDMFLSASSVFKAIVDLRSILFRA